MRYSQVAWILLLVIAGGLKAILLLFDRIPFNADEAIVALMARHILLKGERPIFFYGQAYMGSLDAFLVAIGFAVFGFKVWVIRAVQTLLYLLVIVSTLVLIPLIFSPSYGRWYTAALLAIPTVNVTLYTTVSLGGYNEALLIGNLILYCGLKLLHLIEKKSLLSMGWFGTLGFWVGLGLWVNGLTGIYSLPVLLCLGWVVFQRREVFPIGRIMFAFLLFFLGCVIGSSPWWIYAFRHGAERLLSELFGSAIATSEWSWLQQVLANIFNLAIFGSSVVFGLRPPWEVRWIALPLAPFILAIWLAIMGFWTRLLLQGKLSLSHWVLNGVALTFTFAFVFTHFGGDPSGRYFLPLWIILTLIAGEMIVRFIPRVRYQVGVVVMVATFNLWGVIECAMRYPPGLTTQFNPVASIDHRYLMDLIRFLQKSGETHGYTNYWVAYPLAFLSEEKIIYAPRLPYHPDLRYTPRDDRYQPYTDQVVESERIAYITTKNTALDQYLTEKFRLAGIEWQEIWIGEYHVFYRLSRAIHPQEIGLGMKIP